MEWSLQGDSGRAGGAGIIYKLAVESPWEYAVGNRTELTRVDKMTSKVFSIFSVYDFVIVCSSLKHSSYSYSLGPETHEIIVSKISSNETVLREPCVLGHLFPFKTGLERNKQDKGNKEEIGVYCSQSWQYYFSLYSLTIFDQMQNYSYRLYLNLKAVSLGLY